MKFKFVTSLFAILLMIAVSFTASANNGDPGKDKKNEGAKIELANQIVSVEPVSTVPDFYLNGELVTVTVLPACGGDTFVEGTSASQPPSGYSFSDVDYDSFGYTINYTRTCTEVISCGICPPPGFFTYTSSDTYSVRVNMLE